MAALLLMFNCAPAPSMMSLPVRLVSVLALAEASEQGRKAVCNKNVYCLLFSKKAGTKRLARVSACGLLLPERRGDVRSLGWHDLWGQTIFER